MYQPNLTGTALLLRSTDRSSSPVSSAQGPEPFADLVVLACCLSPSFPLSHKLVILILGTYRVGTYSGRYVEVYTVGFRR